MPLVFSITSALSSTLCAYGTRTRCSGQLDDGAVVRVASGLVAAVGTLAMDALRFARYRRGGGDSGLGAWEFSSDLASWDRAPAPAQVGKRLIEGCSRSSFRPSGPH